ncbi:MAG: DUF2007 domain-containing protein [Planctomycetales bacterium]
MSSELTTIASHMTPLEANLARGVLASEGIDSYLEGENTAGMAWHLSNAMGGVKLQVATDDVPQAVEILDRRSREGGDAAKKTLLLNNCSQCGAESEEGFEVCWECGAEPQPTERADARGQRKVEKEEEEEEEDADYDLGCDPGPMSKADELADRALVAAFLGFAFCPIFLHVYSTWVLIQLSASGDAVSPSRREKVLAAWFINLAMFAAVILCIVLAQTLA